MLLAETEEGELSAHDDDQDDLEEIETYLTKLQDDEPGEDDVLEEAEAAEILSTMLNQKRKTVSFRQSVERKKDKELSRGYGSTRAPKLQGNLRAKFTIEEIKKKTKCKACGQLGHWHKDAVCPKNKESNVHYIEAVSETNEAYFIGALEVLDGTDAEKLDDNTDKTIAGTTSTESPIEKPEQEPATLAFSTDAILAGTRFELGETDHGSEIAEDYVPSIHDDVVDLGMCYPSECFFVDASRESIEERDSTCATLDTGCQRLAVGLRTLQKFQSTLPEPLRITLRKEQNRFRSIHGVSSTEKIASVPVSLGHKGCFLRPAVFTDGPSQDAPFLISLSFLQHCRAQLCLDKDKGMKLLLHGMKQPLDCHLGPTGALRIPLQEYAPAMMTHLVAAQTHGTHLPKSEFEILTAQNMSTPAATSSSRVSEPSVIPRADYALHRCQQQEAVTGSRGAVSDDRAVAEDSSKCLLHAPAHGDRALRSENTPSLTRPDCRPAGHHDLGRDEGDPDPGCNRDRQEGEGVRGRLQSGVGTDDSIIRAAGTGKSHRPGEDRQRPSLERRPQHGTWVGHHLRDQADLLLRESLQAHDEPQGGQELRENFLPVPTEDRQPMPLHLDGRTADAGPHGVEVQGAGR